MERLSQPKLGPAVDNNVAVIRNDTTKAGSSGEPGISPIERLRRKKLEIGPVDMSKVTPDLADIALRDAATGKVTKARRGSRKDSMLGGFDTMPTMGSSALLGE